VIAGRDVAASQRPDEEYSGTGRDLEERSR
jgi:hypothetical protein